MKVTASSKKNKYCAFCKHWYDPTNSAIKPLLGRDMYSIDGGISLKCIKRNLIIPALSTCRSFELKL